jgi:N-methylhydantoinase A
VTDADLVMGRIDPGAFSGGRMQLDTVAAAAALHHAIGEPLGLNDELAAYGVGEMVDENMANAVRVHAIESGKNIEGRTLVAFGGAAPLHAARIAEKLDIDRVVVPVNAGVGSAVGFLRAPVAYEVVRSNYQRLDGLDSGLVNGMLDDMSAEARAIVERGAPDAERVETRTAFMRYIGQGHEIAVELPLRELRPGDGAVIRDAFEVAYQALYDRLIPGVDIEILSWIVAVASAPEALASSNGEAESFEATEEGSRQVFDPAGGAYLDAKIYSRDKLKPGAMVAGPAVITEDETSTVVTPLFNAKMDGQGALVLTRKEAAS